MGSGLINVVEGLMNHPLPGMHHVNRDVMPGATAYEQKERTMIPATTTRVADQTAPHINADIRRQIEENVRRAAAGGVEAMTRRLAELDHEWDIERTLEANAATASLVGLMLGATGHKKWFALPAVVAGFLLQHAVQGWCPPVPVFRRLGFRTQTEIDYERYALKVLRGDFQGLPGEAQGSGPEDVNRVLHAVER
jgi:hypothetical protein